MPSMTACSLLGIDSTRFFRYWMLSILSTHNSVISLCSCGRLVALESLSCDFIQAQTFSIGFRSGLLPGQSMRLMCGLSWN